MASNERTIRAFEFLRSAAEAGVEVTVEEICTATGWQPSSVKTYTSKKWREHWQATGPGIGKVRRKFLRLTQEQFLRLHTQNTRLSDRFSRARYDIVVSYDFLLPLTREKQLRASLDALFFRDTVERRLRELDADELAKALRREEHEDDAPFLERVLQFVSDHFGGYSLGHVAGRFRAEGLLTRSEVGDLLVDDEEYLIDETTAVVKFIIPVSESREDEQVTDPYSSGSVPPFGGHGAEIRAIQFLFFELFVEAVIESIRGEEEVWLVQTAPVNRIFVWERSA